MNIPAIIHEPKGNLVYSYNEDTLHLRIKTAKGDVDKIKVVAGDPFDWILDKEKNEWVFDYTRSSKVQMTKEGSTKYHDIWFAEVTGRESARIRYAFVLENEEEKILYGCHTVENLLENPEKVDDIFNYFNFPYLNEEDIYKAPSWVQNTVWYQVTLGSYSNSGDECVDYWAGNVEGMIKKLDYIKEMGFTGIYFNPIFQSDSWHKYDIGDYYKIDESYGTNEQFKEFVDKAHSLGIKVVLDAVFNHAGDSHPFWKDVMEKGTESPYYDYFYIDGEKPYEYCGDPFDAVNVRESINYKTFGYSHTMPKWKASNEKVREHLIGSAVYWIKEYNIDGWRCDVSNEVSHDFWRQFRKEVKKANAEAYILGENWDDASAWLKGDQYDGVMHYELAYPIWKYIGKSSHDKQKIGVVKATTFKEEMTKALTMYPKHVTRNMFTLISSHDINRVKDFCSGNMKKVELMYIVMFTYAGSPCVYYGDEVGMEGKALDNRTPMVWNEEKQDKNIQTFIKKIVQLRKNHSSFKAIDVNWLLVDDDKDVVIYEKVSEVDDEKVIVILNNNDDNIEISLPTEMKNKTYKNLFTDENINLEKSLKMNGLDYLLLKY